MFGRLNRLVAVTTVAGVMLVAPSGALACSGGVSAVNVYKECVPTGGGGKPTGGNSSTTGGSTSHAGVIPSRTAKAIKKTGKDSKAFSTLIRNSGPPRRLQSSDLEPATAPSAISSAFDLGSGPTALLIGLAGAAFLLLGGSGMRVWRGRHRA